MDIIFKKSTVQREKPSNFDPVDEHLFKRYWISNRPECHVLKLKNIIVVWYSILNVRKLKFYDEYTAYTKIKNITKLKRLVFLFSKKSVRIKKAVWIIDGFSLNYYHWFTECLPRLFMAENFLDGHQLILPEKFKNVPFVRDSLEFLGVETYFFDPNVNLRISQLVLTSEIGRMAEYQKDLLFKLKEKFNVLNFSNSPIRKIFIARKLAKARNILNEKELYDLLSQFGVEIHYFDDYSLSMQMDLMKETKTLIGIHGAGLTNMLFMPPGGNVLEFRNAIDGGASTNCYFNLASELGLNYFYTTNKSTNPKTNHADFEIDILKLRKALEDIKML